MLQTISCFSVIKSFFFTSTTIKDLPDKHADCIVAKIPERIVKQIIQHDCLNHLIGQYVFKDVARLLKTWDFVDELSMNVQPTITEKLAVLNKSIKRKQLKQSQKGASPRRKRKKLKPPKNSKKRSPNF